MLAKGAWISQQQVRDHTSPCTPHGGEHDSEILSCNIEKAWNNLKVDYNAFDFTTNPTPQITAYAQWLKKQLVSGYVVAWMIMWSGQAYPIYDLTPPAGMYGHVEPVVGTCASSIPTPAPSPPLARIALVSPSPLSREIISKPA